MFAVIYKWKLNPGVSPKAWEENWHNGTELIHRKHGSIGATLHKTEDGNYISYARWHKKQDWETMMQDKSPEKQRYNNDHFVTRLEDPILLELIDDQLLPLP